MVNDYATDELTPEDIRRIREKLRLSQAEAGELLGGGPKAFTKYESGRVRPAASTANLLRVLDASPSALSTLAGPQATPNKSGTGRPLEVTADHISALEDRRLVALLGRLLSAEARASGLPQDQLHLSTVLTAPDEGEDARISWTDGPARTPFLPSRSILFQVKAKKIGPAEAAKEVLDSKGHLKAPVRSTLSSGGTYVVVCSRPYAGPKVREREAEIRAALATGGVTVRDEQVQFRDAGQLANWVNAHPAIAAWLLEQTQPGLVGPLREGSHWAGRSEHAYPWVEDGRLAPLREKLESIVSAPRGVARIVGLSGLGKSRLALEILGRMPLAKDRVSHLSDLVLYAVESEAGEVAVKSAVQNLVDGGLRSIVVIDRCDLETHHDLAAMVKRSGSQVSLVTIDHDVPQGELPTDTIKIEKADPQVIDGILKQLHPNLPEADRERVRHFADGFPELAIRLGNSWLNDEPCATVNDEVLMERLVLGRRAHDPALLLEAAMLLGTFGLLGIKDGLDEDLSVASRLARNRSEADLRAAYQELISRGVVQQKGRLISFQPRPIALELARRQWRAWGPNVWEDVLVGSLPEHLRERAAQQLALLNETPNSIAAEVVRRVCRCDVLATVEGLKKYASVLPSLARIDAHAVVSLLETDLRSLSTDELRGLAGDLRRDLVHTLDVAAFVPSEFERAASLMLSLAVAENESWGNNATGQYKGLFPVLLGDTAADPRLRLRHLDEELQTTDLSRLRIVVDALLSGIKTAFFSRMVGPEIHGARPTMTPWTPPTSKDAADYVSECLERLGHLASRSDSIGDAASVGLGQHLRELVGVGMIDIVESVVQRVVSARGRYWPEAFASLGNLLTYDKESLGESVGARVTRLMELVTPDDLDSRVRFLVTNMPWDYPGDAPPDFERMTALQEKAVDELVQDMLTQGVDVSQYFGQMSQGAQRMAFSFGKSLAQRSPSPQVWLVPLKDAITAIPQSERNIGLLAGYLTELAKTNPELVSTYKEEASHSPIFAKSLPFVCANIGITATDVQLVLRALNADMLRPLEMMQWSFGGVLAKLSITGVVPLFDYLLCASDEAYSVGLTLMRMYVHARSERLDQLRAQLRLVAIKARPAAKGTNWQSHAHTFKELIGWLLRRGKDDSDACAVSIELAKYLVGSSDFTSREMIKPLLPRMLSEFGHLVWPILGQAIVEDRRNAWQLEHVLGDRNTFHERPDPSIFSLPIDVLFAWCHANPDVGPAFVGGLFPVIASRSQEGQLIHPVVMRLLNEFGDRADVLSALSRGIHTFSWSGSRANYYRLYLKPLADLDSHPIPSVRKWAARQIRDLTNAMESARNEDVEQAAHWGE